jgi:hypothetical protein
MHIIQYLLNLPFKNNFYKSEGKLIVLTEAEIKLIYDFKSILKFKPNDIGYDINGTAWKIISVYSNNNYYSYEAFNGTKVVTFDNFDIYNASEINDIYQNNLDSKIQSIINKIKQIESCIPPVELVNKNSNKKDLKPNLKKQINNKKTDNKKNIEAKIMKPENNKITKGDIIVDKNNHEWSVIEILEFNKKIKYKAVRKNTTKIFNEKDIKKKIN